MCPTTKASGNGFKGANLTLWTTRPRNPLGRSPGDPAPSLGLRGRPPNSSWLRPGPHQHLVVSRQERELVRGTKTKGPEGGRLLLADDALLPVPQNRPWSPPPKSLKRPANSEFFRPQSQPTGSFVNTKRRARTRRHDCDDDKKLHLKLRHRPRIPADGASFAPPQKPIPFPTVAAFRSHVPQNTLPATAEQPHFLDQDDRPSRPFAS
ncbi:hypothetical protein QBC40DRAFT_294508 [Triangularia verruculosa]|uniref:Uncharacterized protein n=1 Tax=Triangularia verruculosa TaxID=2587418 RepID=A0AAN6XRX3_9PEZI|nr:hypothetical protein QBC40DRAFT_294508 [Triangularia verruculosa]